VDDIFDSPVLRIRQPGKLLPNRASYEIFNAARQRLAIATETEALTRRQLLSKALPDARVLTVTTARHEPILTLVKHSKDRFTDLYLPAGELAGRIRATGTTRHYALTGDQEQAVGAVVGDLALKRFSVTGPEGGQLAKIRKSWAGLAKEMLTPLDHYKVEFTGPVPGPARTLIVMMAIVLDLTLYGPV
jgi:Scramblase